MRHPGQPSRPSASRGEATELVGRVPAWLMADHEELWGNIVREPERVEIDAPVDEKLVVEFYSK